VFSVGFVSAPFPVRYIEKKAYERGKVDGLSGCVLAYGEGGAIPTKGTGAYTVKKGY
jgi:hypothetical protein